MGEISSPDADFQIGTLHVSTGLVKMRVFLTFPFLNASYAE
jgi:hypothetical protein